MNSQRLLVDVGNSRVKFGLFDDTTDANGLPKCWNSTTINVGEPIPWNPIRNWANLEEGRSPASFLAGSNPREMDRIQQEWIADFGPIIRMGYRKDTFPLDIAVPEPARVGIDRLLNGIAGNRLRSPNQSAFLVDTGTATTVDVVDATGAFLGGAILPGFELSARALHDYTALLPLIPMSDFSTPPTAIGKNTREAMQSGLFWSQTGAVKELLSQFQKQLSSESPLVLITGGGGAFLVPQIPDSVWMPHLSLQGLAVLLETSGLGS